MTSMTTSQDEPYVLRTDREGVTTLTLNRPHQFNALSQAMIAALQSQLDGIAVDAAVRVVVIAGAGKAFCAGHDLKEMRANHEKSFMQGLFKQCGRMMMTITQMPQPVIARIHGIATAAGCQLVSMCDLAVAAEAARFATSGINVGLFCATPAVGLSRNLGRKQALEMLLTGEFIDAQTALRQGLINRVASTDALDAEVDKLAQSIVAKSSVAVGMGKQMFYKQLEMLLTGEFIDAQTALRQGLINRVASTDALDAEVDKLAQSIVAKSSVAVGMGKQMFYKQLEMGLDAAYQYASEVMACNMMTDDAAEGIDAFVGKRKAEWKGC